MKSATPKAPYAIIGNSVAAVGGVTGIREVDSDTPITLVAREPHHTYSRPLISYLLGGKVDEGRMPYRPSDFYDKNHVRPLLGVEVLRVDTDARRLEMSNGTSLAFDKLLIAVGGRPIVPPDMTGTDAQGVFTFTTWDDARNIKAYVEKNAVREAVVVGGGLIGLKSVEALVELGIRATVVELADRILSITFDRTASDLATKSLRKAGVEVRCNNTVSEIKRQDGRVTGVVLRDGTEVPCSLVILAVGVVPDTRIVQGSAIQTDRGILVDDHLRTSVAGIYAAGDVAQAADLLDGSKCPIPIFPNAYRQGLVAGHNMAGEEKTYEGGLAMNAVDICGLPTISVGITTPTGDEYEVLSLLDEKAPAYKKIVLKHDRIVGAIFIGPIDRAGIVTGLIKQRVNVSGFKDVLLTEDFGLISLPTEYRKHVVSGTGIAI